MKGGRQEEKYRHEYKYICNAMQNAILKTRIASLMKRDTHCRTDGSYQIRSLYFDDYEDRCFYENENGVDNRDKYRIRIYNTDSSRIVLERKSKRHGMTMKRACPIDERICRQMMNGERPQITGTMPVPLKQILLEMQERCMQPKVIVDYIRYPFVEKNGNVRITFDESLMSSNDVKQFLDDEIIVRPVMNLGIGILEVKWDEFLPDYIQHHLQLDSLRWTSFSKYYLCRRYNTYGGIKI